MQEEYTMYKKVATDMNFVDREKSVETFWEENDIFQKSMDKREGCRNICSMTVRPLRTASPISVTY